MASEATIKFMYIKKISVLLFFIAISLSTSANNGYDLWLKYEKFKEFIKKKYKCNKKKN